MKNPWRFNRGSDSGIAGMSYDEYIRRNVTGPAGMVNTDCYDIKRPVRNMAFGYTKMGLFGETLDDWRVNLYLHPTKGGPAGGGYSTVQDLLRFDIALRNHRLLNKEHLEILTTGKVDRDETRRYAYLFEEKIVNGHRIIGHSGGAAGINATLAMYMESGYTVAIMSNYDGGVGLLRARIEELLTEQ
jgi:D-alanyl-D-alanine carboxypeptidase